MLMAEGAPNQPRAKLLRSATLSMVLACSAMTMNAHLHDGFATALCFIAVAIGTGTAPRQKAFRQHTKLPKGMAQFECFCFDRVNTLGGTDTPLALYVELRLSATYGDCRIMKHTGSGCRGIFLAIVLGITSGARPETTLSLVLNNIVDKNVHLHFLCFSPELTIAVSKTMAPIGPKWLSWCSAWKSYANLLDYNGRNRIGSVVIIPGLVWSQQLAKFAAAREERGLVTWIIVSEHSGRRYAIDIEDVSLFALSSVIIVSSEDSGFKVLRMSPKAASLMEQRARGRLLLPALAGQSVSVGCINANISPPILDRCFSVEKNSVVEALTILNCTFSLDAIPPDQWLDYLYSSKVDVIANAFGFTERRYGQVYAIVNRFGGASYYVPKRTRVSDDLLLSVLPLASLLLLSLVACVGAILLASKRSESLWQLSQDALLALLASVFLFSSPLRSMRSSSRIVLAAWMAACFSLAAYTQSLLTASVTAGARWEADDTLDKIFPKLEAGELLPCVVARTYFELLLREGGVHPSRPRNLIDVMAAAATHRRARTSADDVAARNHESCLKKVAKGTHMYLTVNSDLCLYRGDSQHIAKGKEVLSTIVGGFPMRNDYSFRREITWLIRKAFETGWEIRWNRRMFWNCSEQYAGGSTRAPASPLDARHFVGVFYGCCCASLASLATEILFSWIYRRKGMSRVFANARCIHIGHKT